MLIECITFLWNFLTGMSRFEQIGTVTGMIYIFFCVKQSPICWPFGIISCLFIILVAFPGKLYNDAFLNLIYIILGFYGWYNWLHGIDKQKGLPVRRLSRKEIFAYVSLGSLVTLIWGYLSAHFTNNDYPWWDTVTNVMSLIATYLLARKVLETWPLWIVADVMYIFIYHWKGWNGYSLLMVFYTIMSFVGLYGWWKSYQKDRKLSCAESS